jgi:hypothetical protein
MFNYFILLTSFLISGVAISHAPLSREEEIFLKNLTPSNQARTLLEGQITFYNGLKSRKWNLVLNVVDSLPTGALSEIRPQFSPNEMLNIVVNITHEGINNPGIVFEEMIQLEQIFGKSAHLPDIKKSFSTPFQWAETFSNAQLGSPAAIRKLAQTGIETMNYLQSPEVISKIAELSGKDKELLIEFQRHRTQNAEKIFKAALENEKLYLKEAQAKWEEQRKKFPTLEAQSEKLNDLIAKNDRAGVRKLLEDYLPWPLMEPSERNAWEKWLHAIEHPQEGEKKLIFRGLDDDSVQLGAGGKPYQMSTVLTKNQGHFTRRLRSLNTMREKFGSYLLIFKSEHNKSKIKNIVTLSTMMRNHADDPIGSPFLSASQLSVARNFGSEKLAALLINENRLISNINSGFLGEREILIPLIIFPDEVIHYVDQSRTKTRINVENFKKEVEIKIKREILPEEEFSTRVSEEQFKIHGTRDLKDQIFGAGLEAPSVCSLSGPSDCQCLYTRLNSLLK